MPCVATSRKDPNAPTGETRVAVRCVLRRPDSTLGVARHGWHASSRLGLVAFRERPEPDYMKVAECRIHSLYMHTETLQTAASSRAQAWRRSPLTNWLRGTQSLPNELSSFKFHLVRLLAYQTGIQIDHSRPREKTSENATRCSLWSAFWPAHSESTQDEALDST